MRADHSRPRAGFTIVELLIAVVLLTVVAISLVGTSQYVSRTLARSTAELRAGQALQVEMERLMSLPYDSLATGSGTHPLGSSSWTVSDSVTYKEIFLITEYQSPNGIVLWDTVSAFRLR
jgi:prepilin-type N-terminal cleavage/methylation domain-containing protein